MEKFLIIDSFSLLHRAYNALPPFKTKQGKTMNAVYGFLSIFLKAIKTLQPNFIVAAFDSPGLTFRHQEYKEYKANRGKHPEDFYQQIPEAKKALNWFNVPIFEKPRFEADDIIGTISSFVKENLKETEVIILSNDLDLLQLVDEQTKILTAKKNTKVLYGIREIEERFEGIKPYQLVDFRGLKGDPSDNIPGVPGVGEKTAIRLIKEFDTLENLYQKIETGIQIKESLLKKLTENKEQAFLSKSLSEIKRDVPLEIQIKDCFFEGFNKKEVAEKLKDLGFYSLINRLP